MTNVAGCLFKVELRCNINVAFESYHILKLTSSREQGLQRSANLKDNPLCKAAYGLAIIRSTRCLYYPH